MQSDRELLGDAAKAAGYEINAARQAERDRDYPEQIGLWINDESTCWNPLIDSGHALRLAVKLRLCLFLEIPRIGIGPMMDGPEVYVEDGEDEMAATRRAIVRAAAWLATPGSQTYRYEPGEDHAD